jgi:hypothetical protein
MTDLLIREFLLLSRKNEKAQRISWAFSFANQRL